MCRFHDLWSKLCLLMSIHPYQTVCKRCQEDSGYMYIYYIYDDKICLYINTLKWLKFLKDEWHFSRQFMRCIYEDHTNDVDLCLKSFIALNLRTILLFNQSHVNQTWQHDYWCFGVTWHQFLNGIVLTYVWPQVISCETKASACDHTLHVNYWRGFWIILAILAVKSTPESL